MNTPDTSHTADNLTLLGSTSEAPTHPDNAKLETIPNAFYGTQKCVVKLLCPEFTAVCPKTAQPDFATLEITYVPQALLIESKALKLYLFSFRNVGMFHEFVVNKIARDLFNALQPESITVEGKFLPRGGISIHPTCTLTYAEHFRSLYVGAPGVPGPVGCGGNPVGPCGAVGPAGTYDSDMICPNCGTVNSSAAPACRACHRRLKEDAPVVRLAIGTQVRLRSPHKDYGTNLDFPTGTVGVIRTISDSAPLVYGVDFDMPQDAFFTNVGGDLLDVVMNVPPAVRVSAEMLARAIPDDMKAVVGKDREPLVPIVGNEDTRKAPVRNPLDAPGEFE